MRNEYENSFNILIYPHLPYRATNGYVSSCQNISNICINLDNKGSPLLIIVFGNRIKASQRSIIRYCDGWNGWMEGYITTLTHVSSLSPSHVSHSVLLSHVSCRSNSKGVTQVAYTQCGPAIGLSFAIVRQEQPIWFGLSMPWQPKTSITAPTRNRPWVKDIVGSRTDHDLGLREGTRRHASKCNNSD